MSNATPLPPPPTGAVDVGEWEQPHVTGHPYASRYWVGSKRIVEIEQHYTDDITVAIDGLQHADGCVERYITVNQMHPDHPITPQQAREVAVALIAAVDEIADAIELEWTTAR